METVEITDGIVKIPIPDSKFGNLHVYLGKGQWILPDQFKLFGNACSICKDILYRFSVSDGHVRAKAG